jgi:hypothetical protein
MRIFLLLALILVPVIAQAARVDLIYLAPQPSISGGCPAKVHFTGRIRANGPLDVTYQWLRSDGAHTEHTLHFTKATTQSVATDWQLNTKLTGWMQLVILEPTRMQTAKADFTVNCGK